MQPLRRTESDWPLEARQTNGGRNMMGFERIQFDRDVQALAALIRRVDGNHSLGAAELAEELVAHGVTVR